MDAVFNIILGMEHWTSQITLSAIVLGLAVIWARYTSKAQIPRVGISPGFFNYNLKKAKAEFAQHGIKLLQDGYNRFNNSPFLVQTSDLERIVLPVKYLEELRSCPESELSHREGVCDRFLGYYTRLDVVRQSTLHNEVCQTQLVQSLPSYLPGMMEEVQLAISEILKLEGTGMTSIDYNAVYHILARLNSRVLVGLPLCRDDEWIRVSEKYPQDVFVVAADLRNYTPLLRPFVAPFLASTKCLRSHQRITEEKLVPLIRQRQIMGKSTKPSNLLEWMVDLAKGEDAKPSNLVQKMLFLTMATFHASTATAVHVLYDLCSYPEYVQVLRDEINDELAAAGGEWSIGVIHRLKRLDSFLKESQRYNPPGSLGFSRKVMQPLTLKDGTKLPKGSLITMPLYSTARDPKYWKDPDAFDADRFFRMRQELPDDEMKFQFATPSAHSMGFGYGKFACPGRVYASVQLKLVLAMFLRDYDLSFPEDQKSSPANIFFDEMILPDKTQKINVRRHN